MTAWSTSPATTAAAGRNVTPPGDAATGLCRHGRSLARTTPTRVYVSATCYKLADYQPYLFRTRDSGRTWQSITGDFPRDEITRVIRADPVQPGLLFVGTETGIFFSLDDGAALEPHARPPPGRRPSTTSRSRTADLVAGTHGRSFWILDDITPLRALADGDAAHAAHRARATRSAPSCTSPPCGACVPAPSTALCFGIGGGITTTDQPDGRKKREFLDVGENPPAGAIVYYWLEEGFEGAVTLTFRDGAGADIISFRSDDEKLAKAKRPSARPGLNRFVWDLKYPGPVSLDPLARQAQDRWSAEPDAQSGPVAVPGEYEVALTAGT